MIKVPLVTYKDDDFDGDGKEYVSHGIHPTTMQIITLPPETPTALGAKWDSDIGYHLEYPNE